MADEKRQESEKTGGEKSRRQESCEKTRGGKNELEKSRREKRRRKRAPKNRLPKRSRRRKGAKAKPAPLVVRASSRYVRIAPRKARLVADQVRGLQIDQARALLQFSPRGAARDIGKLIDSAAANAENNHDLVADEMRVAEITVDEGPTLRRYRPRALGRATPINKRTSHIAVALSPEGDL